MEKPNEKIVDSIKNVFQLPGIHTFLEDIEHLYLYKDSIRGMDFIAVVVPQIKGDKVTGFAYNDVIYDNIANMLGNVAEYNSKLPYPSYTYDPHYHKIAQIETKIDWYMYDVLGFSRPNYWSSPQYVSNYPNSKYYIKQNIYGEIVSHIFVVYEENDADIVSGQVCRMMTNQFAWVSSDFNGVDECIASINGMIEVEYLTDIVFRMDTMKVMTNERNYDGMLKIVKGLDVEVYNMRNATKALLQDALKRLEDE